MMNPASSASAGTVEVIMKTANILKLSVAGILLCSSQSSAQTMPYGAYPNQGMQQQGNLQPNPLLATPIQGQQQGMQQGMMNYGSNAISQSGLAPQMGMGNMQSQGMVVDPQLGLNNPMMGMPEPGFRDPMTSADAPGITNPFSIQSLVDNANAQVNPMELQALKGAVQSYVDGNLGDARKQFTEVTQGFAEGVATDRAYLGLAKIERAYGAYDVSRRILEGVIRKNRDYESIMLARRSYQDLLAEVTNATEASRQDMEMSYAAYKQVSWWNIFSKIKSYNRYKDSKANYEALLVSTKQFDPIFAQVNITTPVPDANMGGSQQNADQNVPDDVQNQIDNTLTLDELKAHVGNMPAPAKQQPSFLNPSGTPGVTSGGVLNPPSTIAATSTVAPPAETEVVTQPAPVTPPAQTTAETQPQTPISQMSLDEARDTYLKAYEDLKEALKGDDANLKRDLQQRYRSALTRYNELRSQN